MREIDVFDEIDVEFFEDFDIAGEKEKRRKRRENKLKCDVCGEVLSKKEVKNGLCWDCFEEVKGE